MKTFIRIALAIALVFIVLGGIFQLSSENWINAGWNGGVSALVNQQVTACFVCNLVDRPIAPLVGWNGTH